LGRRDSNLCISKSDLLNFNTETPELQPVVFIIDDDPSLP
jgi:hypothetical protein